MRIMQKSGFPKTEIRKQKIGKIIFSKVLEMPLVKYFSYIEKTTKEIPMPFLQGNEFVKKKLFYAKIRINPHKSGLRFEISDERLVNIYSTENCTENKIICSLKWINTRNEFSLHILKSLLDYQSEYWFYGKETDLKPLTLKKFLSLYPLQYLDQTRFSRLITNLSVINPQNQLINLRSLFISKKKYHAHLIREIVYDNENGLKDKDIQYLLAQKGVHLSVRTICNCRKLLNIPDHKEKSAYYYERDVAFSDYIPITSGLKKISIKFPIEAGVYELSISSKIDYLNHRSNVIYIGSSKNLRKRIASYSGNKLKNVHLKNFINNYDVFMRFCLTEDHILIEKNLLKNFKNKYNELPKANNLGG